MPPTKPKQHPKSSTIISPKLAMNHIRTPDRSPIRKRVQITQRQKQTLINNLQWEVTERARRLRAQYALQARDLRTKVERRLHRIPPNLLKANMGELLLEHVEAQARQKKDREPPAAMEAPSKSNAVQNGATFEIVEAQDPPISSTTARMRGAKRTSTAFDKENDVPTSPHPTQTITTPKKRAKPNPKLATTTVLSPKSSNSRTLPASPFKDTQKTMTTAPRPPSPLKPTVSPTKSAPSSPAKAAALAATSSLASLVSDKFKSKTTRAAAAAVTRKPSARQLKKDEAEAPKAAEPKTTARQRGAKVASAVAAALRTVSGASNASNASNATTVVTKKGAAKAGTAAKRVPSAAATKATVVKKAATAAAKKVAVKAEAPAQGRRVLRKRN